ncbi:MAG TPA: MFS transporter [Mycobacteriales bacterium]|nr:MFS transporter [Mycobacteriales bacterium]
MTAASRSQSASSQPAQSPQSQSQSGDGYTPDPRRWRALAVVLVAGFMVLLDVSIVNVALPSIAAGLKAGDNALQWVVSGYALAFGLVLVAGGRIGDARGRRPTLVLGLAVFTLASAACGAARTPLLLVVARLVQGLGGGLVTPQNSGLIQSLFRGEERGRAFGLFGGVVGVSTAVGPLVGGLLIHFGGAGSGWRWIFLVNVPIGILAIVLAFRTVPHVKRPKGEHHDYDPVGAVILGVATVLVLLPFVESRSWSGSLKWTLLVPAALLGYAFVRWERSYRGRGHEPMVDLALFRHRSYAFGTVLGMAYFAGFTAIFFVYSQFLQDGVGYSALKAGLASMPWAIGGALSAVLAGRVVFRIGRALVAAGLVLVILGVLGSWIAIGMVDGGAVGWAVAGPFFVAGIGNGLAISPNQTLTLAEVPPKQGGAAGGVLQTGQRIGSAAGIAAVGSLFYSQLPDFAAAVRDGFLVVTAFVVVALAVAVADMITNRGR